MISRRKTLILHDALGRLPEGHERSELHQWLAGRGNRLGRPRLRWLLPSVIVSGIVIVIAALGPVVVKPHVTTRHLTVKAAAGPRPPVAAASPAEAQAKSGIPVQVISSDTGAALTKVSYRPPSKGADSQSVERGSVLLSYTLNGRRFVVTEYADPSPGRPPHLPIKGGYVEARGELNGQPLVVARDPASGRVVMAAIPGPQGTIVSLNAMLDGLDDGQVLDVLDHLVPVTASTG